LINFEDDLNKRSNIGRRNQRKWRKRGIESKYQT